MFLCPINCSRRRQRPPAGIACQPNQRNTREIRLQELNSILRQHTTQNEHDYYWSHDSELVWSGEGGSCSTEAQASGTNKCKTFSAWLPIDLGGCRCSDKHQAMQRHRKDAGIKPSQNALRNFIYVMFCLSRRQIYQWIIAGDVISGSNQKLWYPIYLNNHCGE